MKFTHLFTKTRKEAPSDEVSRNAQLLIRAGFIHKEMAGVYDYLPLGLRTLNKVNNIIREEMNHIGGVEVFLSALQQKELWQKTDRWDDEKVDVWFKTKLKNDAELGLGLTHEEPLTNLMRAHINSYKDLPKYIHQIQSKFRNETRSKSGILRGREFLMKDLYSFSRNQEELDIFYEKAKDAYIKIFERVGIGDFSFTTFASGGIFSKYSHEFQAICDTGEDLVYLDRKRKIAINNEVYNDEVIRELGLENETLEKVKSIEIGNIFKLGTEYSAPLGLNFIDENGEEKPVVMGSYGIGCGRLMGAVVELLSDSKGIVWPESISPYKVHLIGLGLTDEKIKEKADDFYHLLQHSGVEVLYDDRVDASAGEKFADSDLIGIPNRVVISAKTKNKVELKKRTEEKSTLMEVDELLNNLLESHRE